ncbi:SCO family protein [Rhizobium mongolense]|uniref:SCO family protein n=1 Tax=Rhizobium mongolense TaxID=57676 RepID=UPI0034A46388
MSGINGAHLKPPCSATDQESAILASLRQDAVHFAGLSTKDVERRRAEIFASLGTTELPANVMPVIKEELRTSLSPIVLAGIARAIRRSRCLETEVIELLQASAERISRHDEYAVFSVDDGSVSPLTATQELAVTIDTLSKERVSCCKKNGPESGGEYPSAHLPALVHAIIVENQSGTRYVVNDLLRGNRTLLAFFYTRCMNPTKCSLTVTRLATIARNLEQSDPPSDLLVLACTYDPDFDLGPRLEAYGRDRGFPFNEKSMMVRCVSGWDVLRDIFRLKVGYSATTVNDHAREVFLIGPELSVEPLSAESLASLSLLETSVSGSAVIDIDAVAAASCCCG